MATLKLTIIPSRINTDGTHSIRVGITHKRSSLYITTNHKIKKISEWKNGQISGRADATIINVKLRRLISEYQNILDTLPCPQLTCKQIRNALLTSSYKMSVKTVQIYGKSWIEELNADGRQSNARIVSRMLTHFLNFSKGDISLEMLTPRTITDFDRYLRAKGMSDATVHFNIGALRTMINNAIKFQIVKYEVSPFAYYSIRQSAPRDINISLEELKRLRDYEFPGVKQRRYKIARDIFMLSFYCAGINLVDLVSAKFDIDNTNSFTFVRTKSKNGKQGEKRTSFTLQPEAIEIIRKYLTKKGTLDFGYKFSNYDSFRGMVANSISKIGVRLGFEKPLMYYSARKTFCQLGYELGVPLYILEYAIGHTIKEAHNRPIFDYIKIMKSHADIAIRKIIDSTRQDNNTKSDGFDSVIYRNVYNEK